MSDTNTTKDWKPVPVEPTPEMLKAGTGWGTARSTWAAMLAAAPSAPAAEPEPRPKCSTRGMLAGGMCSHVVVGGIYCSHGGACINKVTPKEGGAA